MKKNKKHILTERISKLQENNKEEDLFKNLPLELKKEGCVFK